MNNGVPPHLWLMHDGAPPHFLPAFRKFLNIAFPKERICRGKPTVCPSRSSDLHSSWSIWGLLSTLKKLVTSRTCDKEKKI